MIPKKIHYCWFGGKPLNKLSKKCIESWKKFCPDYEIIQWNEKNYNVAKNKYMHQAYENQKFAFVSDYARLDIIYNEGGIYLDTDVEIIKPIDDLIALDAFAGIEAHSQYVAVGLGFGAKKGNLLIKQLLDHYEDLEFIKDGQMDLTPIPIVTDEVFKENGYVYSKQITKCCDMHIYPSEYFCPMDMNTGKLQITENTYTIHHYSASWCDKRSKLGGKVYRLINRVFGEKFANALKKVFGRKNK